MSESAPTTCDCEEFKANDTCVHVETKVVTLSHYTLRLLRQALDTAAYAQRDHAEALRDAGRFHDVPDARKLGEEYADLREVLFDVQRGAKTTA